MGRKQKLKWVVFWKMRVEGASWSWCSVRLYNTVYVSTRERTQSVPQRTWMQGNTTQTLLKPSLFLFPMQCFLFMGKDCKPEEPNAEDVRLIEKQGNSHILNHDHKFPEAPPSGQSQATFSLVLTYHLTVTWTCPKLALYFLKCSWGTWWALSLNSGRLIPNSSFRTGSSGSLTKSW